MAGTLEGGKKASATIKDKYGVDSEGRSLLHKRVGAIGGKKTGVIKGFAIARTYALDDPRHPSNAGRKGGLKSNRTKAV